MPKGTQVIYFYYGTNDFAIKRQVSSLVSQFTKKHGAESVTRLEAGQTDVDKLLSEIVNIGLFSADRLIIIDDVFNDKTLANKLTDSLPRVPDETNLVLTSIKPDKRTKLHKELVKIAKTQEFAILKPYEVEEFARGEAADQRVEAKPDGIKELVIYTGGDQWKIANEIAKFKSLDKVITPQNVGTYVEPVVEANAFKILDAVFNSKRDSAVDEVQKLKKSEDANKFFGLLASQVFALSAAVNAGGRSSRDVAADMKVHPFVMSNMFEISHKLSPDDVKKMSQILAKTDTKLTTTSADPWVLIELALSEFC